MRAIELKKRNIDIKHFDLNSTLRELVTCIAEKEAETLKCTQKVTAIYTEKKIEDLRRK